MSLLFPLFFSQVKTFMLRASQSVESLELRVDEVGSKADRGLREVGLLFPSS